MTATKTDTAKISDIHEFLDVLDVLFGGPPVKTADNDFPTFIKAVESLIEDLKFAIEDEPLHVVTAALGEVLAETVKKWPKRHQPGTVADIMGMLYDAIGAEVDIKHVFVGPDGKEVAEELATA